jgi:hypothetical protein
MLLLLALVKGAKLSGEFGLSWSRLRKPGVVDGVGPAAHLPEDLRDRSIVLSALVPTREKSGPDPAQVSTRVSHPLPVGAGRSCAAGPATRPRLCTYRKHPGRRTS